MSEPRIGQSKGVKSPKVILDTRDKDILWNIIKSSNGGKVRQFMIIQIYNNGSKFSFFLQFYKELTQGISTSLQKHV